MTIRAKRYIMRVLRPTSLIGKNVNYQFISKSHDTDRGEDQSTSTKKMQDIDGHEKHVMHACSYDMHMTCLLAG